MATALDVIEAAFRKARVYASGDTIEAVDSQDALEALNDMMHGFDSTGIEYAHSTLALAATVNMPDSLIGHLKAMLALRVTTEWETEPTEQLRAEAVAARQFMAAYYLDTGPAAVDPGLLDMPSQRKFF